MSEQEQIEKFKLKVIGRDRAIHRARPILQEVLDQMMTGANVSIDKGRLVNALAAIDEVDQSNDPVPGCMSAD